MTTTYQPQAGDRVVPGATAVTELGTVIKGAVAACGWAAERVVEKIVNPGADATPAGVTRLTEEAVARHQTVGKFAASGQATPANIKYIASAHGIHFLDLTQSQAVAVAGITPVEIGVSNARAFGGADSNVSGHYVTEVGKTAKGDLIVVDPNQPQSTRGQANVYTQAQLTAAKPFWFGAPDASSGMGSGQISPLAYVPPGGPGPIWTPQVGQNAGASTGILQGIGSTIGNILGGVGNSLNPADAIGSGIDKVLSAATVALKRIGVFAIGLALVALGLFVLFRPQIQQAGQNASKAALLAA